MAQPKHFLLLVRAWGKRSGHSVDWGHAPPAASHRPRPMFVPANLPEFLLESCSVSGFFSYIIPSFPLFFQLIFHPGSFAPKQQHALLTHHLFLHRCPSPLLPLLGFVFALLQATKHPLSGWSWTVFGALRNAWDSLGRYRASSRNGRPAAPGLAKGAAATWRSSPSVC